MNPDVLKEAELVKAMYETANERDELPTVQQIARELKTAPARVSVLLELLEVPIRRGGKPQVIHTLDDLKSRCRCDPEDENSCWLWLGSCDDYGYGTVSVAGRSRRVHQVALELTGVRLRPGQQTRRLCQHAHCCNPAHVAYRAKDVAIVDATRAAPLDRSRGRRPLPPEQQIVPQHEPNLVPIARKLPAPASAALGSGLPLPAHVSEHTAVPAATPASASAAQEANAQTPAREVDPLDFWAVS